MTGIKLDPEARVDNSDVVDEETVYGLADRGMIEPEAGLSLELEAV